MLINYLTIYIEEIFIIIIIIVTYIIVVKSYAQMHMTEQTTETE